MAANSISTSDRQAISTLSHFAASNNPRMLQRPPLNNRDASGSSKNSKTLWKQDPTPIAIPSNHSMLNPFDRTRLKNNLNSESHNTSYGNKQRQRTLTSTAPSRPSKRRKTSNGAPLTASEPQSDITIISCQDDTPQAGPSSIFAPVPRKPPPQNSRDSPKQALVVISSDEEGDNTPAVPNESASAPPDGKNSAWLQQKITRRRSPSSHSAQSAEVEEISEFTDPQTPKSGRPGEPGFVKKQVRKLDRKEQASRSQQNRGVPQIDLATLTNVKGKMKAKATAKPKHTMHDIDPVATASTPFTSNNQKAAPKNTKWKTIPLKEIYFGLKHLKEGYRLEFNPKGVQSFRIEGPDCKEIVTFAQSVKSMQFGDPNHSKLCIKFTSKPLPPDRRHTGIGKNWEEDFLPGEPGRGEVTLKVDKDNPVWSVEVFQTFKAHCKRIPGNECSEVLGLQANLSIWSLAERAAEELQEDTRQENAEVDSDPLNLVVSLEEDPDPPPQSLVSNERSKRQESSRPGLTTRRTSTNQTSSPAPQAIPRRSTRQQQQNQTKEVKKQPSADPDEIILRFPPDAATGAVKLTNGDYNRLLPNEYLNDTLIEFGLKLWLHELAAVDPDLANQVHIFNSFFYKQLNKKNFQDGYQSVRRWTSKFDIFSKKFVIVPINENLHWYLAIIYQPNLVLLPPRERELPTRHNTRSSNAHEEHASGISTPVEAPSPTSPTVLSNEAEPAGSSRRSASSTTAVSVAPSPSESGLAQEDSDADAEETAHGLMAIDISVEVQMSDSNDDPPSPHPSIFGDDMKVDEDLKVDYKAEENNLVSPSFTSLVTSSRNPRDLPSSMEVERPLSDVKGVSNSPGHPKTTSVPASSFYAAPPQSRKGKEKAVELAEEIFNDDSILIDSQVHETDEQPKTTIFTLDSLGSKHPRAVNILKQYLIAEAEDKKQLQNTNPALGRTLSVPTQPNYCDCGVYLIHFAQVFVQRAEYFANISQKKGTRSQTDRNTDWDGHRLNDFRDELRQKVDLLSKTWKEENQPRPQEPEKTVVPQAEDRRTATVVHELSDSDIDIVEPAVTDIPERKVKARGSMNVARVRGN
ncbi:hypothetical protein F5878DRAFT_562963 [Lentinula raphanica]|uniref:Ubiquitin-like protease family profile domain-containing protein n=1 Tax=Lentinula raphanica TaxID=153919 RepID=A0AA38UE60_9AGAR|nr:hypothetical protein F5878DRAFT_562963 [Lentinula raphanica]